MVYVQYYEDDKNEALGDRGIIILDGRNSMETLHEDARRFNNWRRPKYYGYRIFKGERFSTSKPISEFHTL